MSIFKSLTKAISERNFFDESEVEDLIKVYFEMHQQDLLNNDIASNDIVRRRNAILARKRNIELEKNVIEKQLLIARGRLKENNHVDTEWMARANFAFRIKKNQISALLNDLTNLKSHEKQVNIEKSINMDGLMIKELRILLDKEVGKDRRSDLFKESRILAEERIRLIN